MITAWDESRAWFPGMDSYVKDMLLKTLRRSSSLGPTDIKRIVRKVMSREAAAIPLENDQHIDSIRHWLESIGAQVEIIQA